jgi:hypothetical protein
MGGLVIIVDLATRLLQQQGGDTTFASLLEGVDYALNATFFAIAGANVLRETGRVALAAIAGAVAGLVDGAVVSAATLMAPPPGLPATLTPDQLVMESLLWNALIGIAVAAASAWFSLATRKRVGGP